MRSYITTIFGVSLLAMKPTPMPSLTTVTSSSRPSTLANETVPSTVDFIGATEEMGSTVPSFSFSPSMDFIQSIVDFDSITSFAGDFKASFSFFATDLVEAFAEGFSPSVDFIRSMDYSIKAFAEDFNSALDLVVDRFNAMRTLFSEKYEALAASTYKLFDEKYEASIEDLLSDPFGVLAAQSISSAPA
eukprot:CAMPEP_0113637850 /NCGR_PEP_ID=MMETSP0017_2-20120614/19822_1 /TAXON_ID=2856 /ORGANISM="Cylindrotheca closterium" /LENGTH=188 /DNA_ID=CAMNT_0000548917 /DNA_START=236 /DNA_END=799 /DNA_ORIENTATION=- /assembly_acc=CAM_ASM_000147